MKYNIELNIDPDNMVTLLTVTCGGIDTDADNVITDDDPPATLKDAMAVTEYIIEQINREVSR